MYPKKNWDEVKISDHDYIELWIRFAYQNNFVAKSLLTFTFDRKRKINITPDRAYWEFRYLIRRLNQYIGGPRYRKKWGHSYFGYIFGVEKHKDGVFHAHAVIDNWIDFRMMHEIWNERCGYAWTKIVDDDIVATRYVLKYLMKTDIRPTYFFQKNKQVVNDKNGSISRCSSPSKTEMSRGSDLLLSP